MGCSRFEPCIAHHFFFIGGKATKIRFRSQVSHGFRLLRINSPFISGQLQEAIYSRLPVDDIEPEEETNSFRECARKAAFIMNRYALFIVGAENPLLHAWAGAFALGLPCCEGKNYTEIARVCAVGQLSPGKGRAAVSKAARFFCEANGLPPSFYMKSQQATQSYKTARLKSINERNQELG